MKVLVQWATAVPGDWQEIDSADWHKLPSKPLPVGGEPIDAAPGWVTALNVQGVEFTGYDHYAVEDIADGGIRVTVWNDDPDDQDLAKVRQIRPDQGPFAQGFYGQVWTFHPLAPDPAMGGAWNTRQTMTYFAEDAKPVWALLGDLPKRPWGEFRPPPAARVKHGIWLTPEAMTAHQQRQSHHGWREWTDGVPASQVRNGQLQAQRPQGLYNKPRGTLTVFQAEVASANGIHAAISSNDEFSFQDTEDSNTDSSGSLAAGTSGFFYIFTSATTFPNSADWPSGTYRCQLDVSAAGANVTYGFRTVGAADGHFARVDSGLTADQETATQAEAAFSGTGLKLATVSWDPAAGDATDRFECLLAGTNAATMNAGQAITITFDADAFADGPWNGGAAAPAKKKPAHRRLMGVGA